MNYLIRMVETFKKHGLWKSRETYVGVGLHAVVRPVVMTEGIEGHWHYHLSVPSDTTKGLCGKQTMPCGSLIDTWGYVGHLREKYCEECKRLACDPNTEKK